MNRRRFLVALGLAPLAPVLLRGLELEEPAGAVVGDQPDESSRETSPKEEMALQPGTILPYAGGDAPEGWLPCDGRAEYIQTYPKLYEAIGATYGRGGADPRTFRLPDFRMRTSMVATGNHNHSWASPAAPANASHTHAARADHVHNMTVTLSPSPIDYIIKI